MITVNHVLSSYFLSSAIFEDLFRRLVAAAPEDIALDKSVRPDRRAALRHYHRPHREIRLHNPSVVTVHHDPREHHPSLPLSRFVARWREAHQVICLNSLQRSLLAAYGVTQVEVIPHGVDRRIFPLLTAPRPAVVERPVRLGLVSRRYKRGIKGEHRLEALYRGLDSTRFEFVFAGSGRAEDASRARAAGFAVQQWEALPYRLFGQLYRTIDALLILSDFEGGPACLPEALGAGVPVLARPVGMVVDWLRDGESGLILDDATLVEQVAGLADPTLRARLNAGAWAAGVAIPDWADIAGRQFAIYRRVVEGH
jgi:glycosyltransferase involved in cell wall biosynthesis